MNEDTTTTPSVTTKPKRTRKPAKPRAPRAVDPVEEEYKQEARDKIEAHRRSLKSGGVLKRIQALVPKLTDEHKAMLKSEL